MQIITERFKHPTADVPITQPLFFSSLSQEIAFSFKLVKIFCHFQPPSADYYSECFYSFTHDDSLHCSSSPTLDSPWFQVHEFHTWISAWIGGIRQLNLPCSKPNNWLPLKPTLVLLFFFFFSSQYVTITFQWLKSEIKLTLITWSLYSPQLPGHQQD